MTFCLEVHVDRMIDDLKVKWTRAFSIEGFDIDFSPYFDPNKLNYQLLEAKISVKENSFRFARFYGPEPIVARVGMEIQKYNQNDYIHPKHIKLFNSDHQVKIKKAKFVYEFCDYGRSVADVRLQWYLAATLTKFADGLLYNTDYEYFVGSYSSESAIVQARIHSEKFENRNQMTILDLEKFENWDGS